MATNEILLLLDSIPKDFSGLRLGIRTDTDTIQNYEDAFGVRLPDDYKLFIEHCNGIDSITTVDETNNLWMKGEYDEALKISNHILDVEDVFEEFESLALDRWKVDPGHKGAYPYIPFCMSGDGEKIIFLNQNLQEDSAIYYAYHDEPASAWFCVAKNFTEFLKYYISTKGELPEDDIGHSLNAEEYEKAAEEKVEQFNSPIEIIKRSSAYLTLFPKDVLSYTMRANAYSDSNQYPKALGDYNKALDLDSDNAFAYYSRGNFFIKVKKARQALTDFDSACQLEPEDPLYLSGRAEAFYKLNKMKKALADCNRAIEIDDRFELAYMTRYDIYLFQGYDDLAQADADMIDELLA